MSHMKVAHIFSSFIFINCHFCLSGIFTVNIVIPFSPFSFSGSEYSFICPPCITTIDLTISSPTCIVKFETDGGVAVDDMEVECGTAIGTLPTTTKTDYDLKMIQTQKMIQTKK